MKKINNIRLKSKIILIIVIIGAVSSITANLVNYFYEINQARQRIISDTQLHARLISEYCSLPLEFNYPDEAKVVLQKLSAIESISDGILYTSDDRIFAAYHRGQDMKLTLPMQLKTNGFFMADDYIHVRQMVQSKQGEIGYVYLRSKIDWQSLFLSQLFLSVLLTALMIFLTFMMAYYFERSISEPIIMLTKQMKFIANSDNYTFIENYKAKDELGELYNGFNFMIERIKMREKEKLEAQDAEKEAWAETKMLLDKADRSARALLSVVEDQKRAKGEIQKLNETLEQRVFDRTAQLENANKELETFTYSVSHDLKAPLRGIDGYSKLLVDLYGDKLNEEASQFIHTIRSSTLQMNQLIEDLLQYSRLERSHLQIKQVHIKTFIESILKTNADDISAHHFLVNIDVPDIELIADANGIQIALRNLIENAIKFTKKTANPEIMIKLAENQDFWILSVRDNGIGFDMKYSERIFEIFQRLQRAENFPGTGIGLAMVAKAMHRMNGKVYAESIPGKGATFYLEIPKSN